ncbi:MAG TPA: CBS domain-containing protein [Candidatus Limnocylindrales bacterium]|nr:CBS domain-containing protein [Candidatus Limnocylindrales bacterium]
MSARRRLSKATPVSAVEGLLRIEPLLARPEDDVLDALRRVGARPATRNVGVVDALGRLVGIVPIVRLAEAVIARVMPEALMADITDVAGVARFSHTVESRTVGEAMLPPAAVRADATIAEAFRIMHARHLSGVYVVDEAGRPTGYLDLLELALAYIDGLELEDEPAAGTPSPRYPSRPPRPDGPEPGGPEPGGTERDSA